MEDAWLAGQMSTILPYSITQKMPPASISATGIQVPTRILHSSVLIRTVVLPDRHVSEKFPRSQHQPSLIIPPRFARPVPSNPVKRWNFPKAKWSHYITLTNKLARSLLLPRGNYCTTYLSWASALLNGRTWHGTQSTPRACQRSVSTFLGSAQDPLEWVWPEQLESNSIACLLALGVSVRPSTNGVSLL